ncbi:flavin reductase (DIM6/NTAB) family NADH-FMN oxidoreductase RutF [Rhodobium orientis]|nr:flavin reductase (DIM6/NTAB) family NADH-FMN oxidoreductase RutF [Rhodobium orientis]
MAGAMTNVDDLSRMVTGAEFREAMSRIASAVHVVTTDGPAGRFGITVSAMASISDAPPTLLACLNRKSPINEAVTKNGVFCVNALSGEAAAIADTFAGRGEAETMEARFAIGDWLTLQTGAPVLADALAAFDCRVVDVAEASTHSVFFGEVVGLMIAPPNSALVYANRSYRSV